MARPITLEQARTRYVHRYTMEHVPQWARAAAPNGKHYAPQFKTDREWYEKTLFAGESKMANKNSCHTSGQSWPLGQWLDTPYSRGA